MNFLIVIILLSYLVFEVIIADMLHDLKLAKEKNRQVRIFLIKCLCIEEE